MAENSRAKILLGILRDEFLVLLFVLIVVAMAIAFDLALGYMVGAKDKPEKPCVSEMGRIPKKIERSRKRPKKSRNYNRPHKIRKHK